MPEHSHPHNASSSTRNREPTRSLKADPTPSVASDLGRRAALWSAFDRADSAGESLNETRTHLRRGLLLQIERQRGNQHLQRVLASLVDRTPSAGTNIVQRVPDTTPRVVSGVIRVRWGSLEQMRRRVARRLERGRLGVPTSRWPQLLPANLRAVYDQLSPQIEFLPHPDSERVHIGVTFRCDGTPGGSSLTFALASMPQPRAESVEQQSSSDAEAESEPESAPEAEAQAEEPEASPDREPETPTFRMPLDAFRTTMAPIPAGPVVITPSARLNGSLDVSPTQSAMARMSRINLATMRPEITQTFTSGFSQAGYEFTSGGLAVTVFDSRLNLEMKVTQTGIEFKLPVPPEHNISFTRGDWRFVGAMGIVVDLTITGNPLVVEALLRALAVSLSLAAAASIAAEIGTALANAVRALFGVLGTAAGAVPIIILPGTLESFEQQQRGPGPIA